MVIGLKLAGLGAAAILTAGSAATTTCCPHETISCFDGHPSFATAKCNIQTLSSSNIPKGYKKTTAAIPTGWSQETLQCPPGESAISGGYRFFDLTQLGTTTIKEEAPLVPSGGQAIGYQYIMRTSAITVFKVYVTCM